MNRRIFELFYCLNSIFLHTVHLIKSESERNIPVGLPEVIANQDHKFRHGYVNGKAAFETKNANDRFVLWFQWVDATHALQTLVRPAANGGFEPIDTPHVSRKSKKSDRMSLSKRP